MQNNFVSTIVFIYYISFRLQTNFLPLFKVPNLKGGYADIPQFLTSKCRYCQPITWPWRKEQDWSTRLQLTAWRITAWLHTSNCLWCVPHSVLLNKQKWNGWGFVFVCLLFLNIFIKEDIKSDHDVSVCFLLIKECVVDEDGRFTELAGPELQHLSVMREGTDKGTVMEKYFLF